MEEKNGGRLIKEGKGEKKREKERKGGNREMIKR